MKPASGKILKATPVTIVTGFLGSGKTTAILEILKSSGPDSRTAVVINEWGQVALDGEIVSGEYPETQVREISGGCICCGAGAELDKTVVEILDRLKPDRIVIEPSGVAKPGDIIDLLRPHEQSGRLTIRPVICLVDPARFVGTRSLDMPVYRDQIESAAILVANRCDLAEANVVSAFFEKASLLYPPKLAIHATSFGQIPTGFLDKTSPEMLSNMVESNDKRKTRRHSQENKSLSQAGWTWPPETVFSESELKDFFHAQAEMSNSYIERAKGVFHTDRGWFLMEIASGSFHQRPIQYRALNGCQFIADSRRSPDLTMLKTAVESCIRTDEVQSADTRDPTDGSQHNVEPGTKLNVIKGGLEQ
jgi:G3E family GTPase